MGLRASYQYLGDKELEALEKFDNEEDIFETEKIGMMRPKYFLI